MCNCYEAKCEQCERRIPVHLADFAIQPECVKVFCSKHIPPDDVVVFEVASTDTFDWPIRKGSRFGFRITVPLPEGYTYDDFCPNICSLTVTTIRPKQREAT